MVLTGPGVALEAVGLTPKKTGPKTCAENVGAKSNLKLLLPFKIDKYRNFILKISWFHHFDGSNDA